MSEDHDDHDHGGHSHAEWHTTPPPDIQLRIKAMESLLVESDGPWKYSGEFASLPSGPWLVARVAEEVAKLKRLPVEDAMAQLTENANRTFELTWA